MPKERPLHTLRALVDGIIANMSAPSEQLLRALLVQILLTLRSERQLVEQPDYNLLFR